MLRTASSLPLHRAFDAGLRPDPFPDRAASLLPGPLVVTRTGLTPASDDELTTRRSATQNHSFSSCLTGRTPHLEEIVLQVLLELRDRHPVHTGRTLVCPDFLPRLPDGPFRDQTAPSLPTTTSRPASPTRIGTRSLTVSHAWDTPFRRPVRTDSIAARLPPVPRGGSRSGSRRLYAGHRLASKQTARQTYPRPLFPLRF
jgi:hypothetical protein